MPGPGHAADRITSPGRRRHRVQALPQPRYDQEPRRPGPARDL